MSQPVREGKIPGAFQERAATADRPGSPWHLPVAAARGACASSNDTLARAVAGRYIVHARPTLGDDMPTYRPTSCRVARETTVGSPPKGTRNHRRSTGRLFFVPFHGGAQ